MALSHDLSTALINQADLVNPRSSSITAVGPIGTWPALAKLSLRKTIFSPNLAEELFEDLNRQLLAWTPPVSEAEWCEAGTIANRKGLPVNNTPKTVPKPLLVMFAMRPSLTSKFVISNGHRARPICRHLSSIIWALVDSRDTRDADDN
jgi:hypothetical protein